MITREPEFFPQSRNIIGWAGRSALFALRDAGRAMLLFLAAVVSMRTMFRKRARREIIVQMFVFGIKSLGVITVVALFTGMILALQTGIELRRFNQEVNIGTAVMVSMLREMGPFVTGLILAACVGSAIAAQIGTMKLTEEVDAMRTIGISPIEALVLPRVMAAVIMMPLLGFYSACMGIIGGAFIASVSLDIPFFTFLSG